MRARQALAPGTVCVSLEQFWIHSLEQSAPAGELLIVLHQTSAGAIQLECLWRDCIVTVSFRDANVLKRMLRALL